MLASAMKKIWNLHFTLKIDNVFSEQTKYLHHWPYWCILLCFQYVWCQHLCRVHWRFCSRLPPSAPGFQVLPNFGSGTFFYQGRKAEDTGYSASAWVILWPRPSHERGCWSRLCDHYRAYHKVEFLTSLCSERYIPELDRFGRVTPSRGYPGWYEAATCEDHDHPKTDPHSEFSCKRSFTPAYWLSIHASLALVSWFKLTIILANGLMWKQSFCHGQHDGHARRSSCL